MSEPNYTPLKLEQYPNLNRGGPPAPPGNDWAMKFKTPESRQDLCKKYCDYLRQGLPKEYFPDCGPQTLAKYIKKYPSDFDIEAIEDAEREGLLNLTKTGYAGMMGNIEGFREKTWMFVMQNMTRFRLKQEIAGPNGSAPFVIEVHPSLKFNEPKESKVIEADVVEERALDQNTSGSLLPTPQENSQTS